MEILASNFDDNFGSEISEWPEQYVFLSKRKKKNIYIIIIVYYNYGSPLGYFYDWFHMEHMIKN